MEALQGLFPEKCKQPEPENKRIIWHKAREHCGSLEKKKEQAKNEYVNCREKLEGLEKAYMSICTELEEARLYEKKVSDEFHSQEGVKAGPSGSLGAPPETSGRAIDGARTRTWTLVDGSKAGKQRFSARGLCDRQKHTSRSS